MTMDGEASDTAEGVVDALMRASRALGAITGRSLASVREDVTLAQFRTLVVLANGGPQTATALAEHLAVHASTMTRMCTRLVNRALVAREPSAVDRRGVVIRPSHTGGELVETVMNRRRQEFDTTVRQLSADEQRVASHALDTFAQAAGEGIPTGTPAVPLNDNPFISQQEGL